MGYSFLSCMRRRGGSVDSREHLAEELADRLHEGQIIGVGTGTTVEAVLKKMKHRISQDGVSDVQFVPTSYQSAWCLHDLGLPVTSPATSAMLDWGFDGADEVDSELRLLKGRGAAMLHEKLIAARCASLFIVVDESKLVTQLGSKMSVPVEVIPEARFSVEQELRSLGAQEVCLRLAVALERQVPLFTQEGNLILDARFDSISQDCEMRINAVPGVVENGIFSSYATEVLVGRDDGVEILTAQ